MTPDDEGNYFLSVTEAGRRLAISRGTAYELAKRGTLRTVRLGTRHLVPVDAIGEAAARIAAGDADGPNTSRRARRARP